MTEAIARSPSGLWEAAQWLTLPVLTGIGFLARASYFEGFADVLGVPAEINFTSPYSLSGLVAFVAGSTGVLAGLVSLGLHSIVHTIIGRILIARGLFFLLLVVSSWLVSGFSVKGALGYAYFGFLWVVLDFLSPLLTEQKTRGYLNKLKAAEAKEAFFGSGPVGTTELTAVQARFKGLGRGIAGAVILLVFLASGSGYLKGRWDAGSKREWAVIEHPKLPLLPDGQRWVVLGKERERIVTAPISASGEISGRFVLVSPDTEATIITPHRLGLVRSRGTEEEPSR